MSVDRPTKPEAITALRIVARWWRFEANMATAEKDKRAYLKKARHCDQDAELLEHEE